MKVGDHWDPRWSIGHFPLGGGPPLPPPPGPPLLPPFPLPFPSMAACSSRIIRRTVCIALVGLMSETGRHSGGWIMRTLAGPSVSLRWEADPRSHRRRFMNCRRRCLSRFLHRRRVAAGAHAEFFAKYLLLMSEMSRLKPWVDHQKHRWFIGQSSLGGGGPDPPPPPVPELTPPLRFPLPFPSLAARRSRIIRRPVCIALVRLMSETGRPGGGRIMRTLAGPSVSPRWEAGRRCRRRRFLHCRLHCCCYYRFLPRRRVAAGSHAELFA